MRFSNHEQAGTRHHTRTKRFNPSCAFFRRRFAGTVTQIVCAVVLAVVGFVGVQLAPAANILWVSDVGVPGTFTGPGSGFTDQGFVTLLQNAGHNVNRFNPSNNNAVALTPTELAAINTNDLILVARAGGSGSWQNTRATNWNRDVIKPMIVMSPYFVRPDGNRLGWFTGGTLPDDVPAPLTPGNSSDPTVDYIFSQVAMNGTNTATLYTEPMDRNTSHIQNPPVAGAVPIATVTSPQEGNAAIVTVNAIVGFPAGTIVQGAAAIPLPAYRMYFSGGTREGATAPNTIWFYTGRENLTPVGENVFLRSVEVALNNGVAPATNTGPAGISGQPVSLTSLQGNTNNFLITVTGAAPRTVQWQRDDGSGTFTNIPGAVSSFPRSTYSFTATNLADNGARFQAVVSNALNVVTSDVAVLTITPDSAPPVPLSAASVDGTSINICFNELVNTSGGVVDPSSYSVDGGNITVNTATVSADGRSVTLALQGTIGTSATVDILYLEDRYMNTAFSTPTLTARNFGLTGINVGTVTPGGNEFACDTNSFQVSAGGVDLGSTADNLRFAYKTANGDFDARVQVTSFVGTNDHFESVAKAMLLARESTASGSASVNVWTTPLAPGDDNVSASYRATTGAATNVFGPSVTPSGLPNAWMRIQRQGNQFTTYRSTNGVNWTTLGTASIPLPASLSVGVGVISHRSGKMATATFSDFSVSSLILPIALTNFSYNAGQFTASFQTQNGVGYTVQYKDNLNTVAWSTLTTIAGDGTIKSFTDPGPVSPTGNRFYRISSP